MELIQGCRDKAEQYLLERELHSYGVIWPSPTACNEALSIFADYYLSHGLGIHDALIGRMAVSLKIALCTFNQKHYSVISGLNILQPYERSHQV